MFKNFEIKLNSVQSILLIISIFAIGILSFALGFTLGKNSSPDIIAMKDSSQESVPLEKKAEDAAQPPPAVSENQAATTEKLEQKETPVPIQTKPPDAGEMTFFKTLPETKSSPLSEKTKTHAVDKGQKKEDTRKESASQKVIPAPQKEAKTQGKSQETSAKLPPAMSIQSSPPLQAFYTVQAGSFKTMDDASKLKSKLEGKGYQSYITTYDTPEGKWFRVRIGQFKTKEQAESAAKKLKIEENLATFIAAYK